MTSEQIKGKDAVDLSTNGWLREVCLQLALLNAKQDPPAIGWAIEQAQHTGSVMGMGIKEAQRASRRRLNDAS